MTDPTTPRRTNGLRMLAVAIVAVAAAGGALYVARSRAHRDWPAMSPPLAIDPPAVAASGAAWPAFEQAIAALPAQRERLGAALEGDDPAADRARLAPYTEALRRFDLALASGETPVVAPVEADRHGQRPYLSLLELARARSLAARLDVTNGHRAESLAMGVKIASLGARLGQQATDWLGVAAAGAIEAQGHRAMARALEGEPIPPDALAAASAAIDATLSLPSPLHRANAGECATSERHLSAFRGKSSAELLATTDLQRPNEQRAGWSLLPASWILDIDATIAAVRHECRRIDAALRRPRGDRTVGAPRRYTNESRLTVGQWLDNRVGRVLLDLLGPSVIGFVERDDDVYASRYTARAALAIATFRSQNQRLPSSLEEARVSASPQPLGRGRAVTFDAAARALTVTFSADRPHANRFLTRWNFSM